MRHLILLLFVLAAGINNATAQGCVAIRNITGFGQYLQTEKAFASYNWLLNVNNRYFKSYRDFKGGTDQKTPKQDESKVYSYTMDLMVSRLMRDGWSVSLGLPISANTRSATLEHGGPGTTRHSTHSFGIGDLRLTTYKWLLRPTVKQKGNIQAGLGIKFPTGDFRVQDYFYRNDTTLVLAPVNPSIQLGDGGTGIISELNGYYQFSKTISIYGNAFYLSNPRDHNGVSTTAGKNPSPLQVQTKNTVASVTDQYSLRAGVDLTVDRLILSAGLRDEGVPADDLIGRSSGTRRAGHSLSFEPGITYRMNKMSVYAYVPIIFDRETRQIVPDKLASDITGTYILSQGGFADYLVFVGALFKL